MMLQMVVDELVEATIRQRYESAGRTRGGSGREEYRDECPPRRLPPGDDVPVHQRIRRYDPPHCR
jgi:hypothetical protein